MICRRLSSLTSLNRQDLPRTGERPPRRCSFKDPLTPISYAQLQVSVGQLKQRDLTSQAVSFSERRLLRLHAGDCTWPITPACPPRGDRPRSLILQDLEYPINPVLSVLLAQGNNAK